MAELVLVQSDSLPKIRATCIDAATGNPIDLTGATVNLKYQLNAGTTQTKSMIPQAPLTAGVAEYQVATGDFPNPGMAKVQIEIVNAGRIGTSFKDIFIEVRPKL